MEIYILNCPKCRQKTEHLIYKTSRRKGVKMRCARCGFVKSRYCNFQTIKEKIITRGEQEFK